MTAPNRRLPAGPRRSQKGLERLGEGRNAGMVTRHLADLAHTLGCAEELATTLAQDGIPAPAAFPEQLRLVVREELARLTATASAAGFVDVPSAAAHAGVTPATIREWVSRGLLPAAPGGSQASRPAGRRRGVHGPASAGAGKGEPGRRGRPDRRSRPGAPAVR